MTHLWFPGWVKSHTKERLQEIKQCACFHIFPMHVALASNTHKSEHWWREGIKKGDWFYCQKILQYLSDLLFLQCKFVWPTPMSKNECSLIILMTMVIMMVIILCYFDRMAASLSPGSQRVSFDEIDQQARQVQLDIMVFQSKFAQLKERCV